MTREELDAHVYSLRGVGGVYDYVAAYVDHANSPHIEGDTK